MELHLIIEGKRDLAAQVYRQLSEAILSGRLAHGQQVPPSRLLAQQLGISRKPVAEAYSRLSYEQLLAGQPGRGTFVNAPPSARPAAPRAQALAAAAALARWKQFDNPLRKFAKEGRAQYDFIGGSPAAPHFPEDDWRRAVNAALRAERAHRTRYSDTAGIPELRQAIARHAAYARGVATDAAHIMVTNGAQQALDLLARVLLEPGACVAVEDPGYPAARQLFASHGARLAPVPVDAEGIVAERIPRDARLIYVTPAHQFPLGMPMSEARKAALLARAREIGAVIIEDDYDSAFRYEGRPADSLQSMDSHGLVVYVGTLSKVLMPELRIGYMAVPEPLLEALHVVRHLSDWHSPTLTQHAAARFIEDGALLRHVRKLGAVYATRREALQRGFAGPLAPWFELVPATAGFHMTALARHPLDIELLVRLARRVDVGLYSIRGFYVEQEALPGLVMGFGAIETLDIAPALARVLAILQEMDT
ncbi:MocR-like pyridoxine biosynthesis transcription factor PdxR [Massilia sp. SM-13]|uniref:MocR-like pyridoxine biosynthesis transcription factor PdxR n=1 Tax=Pseudoduganella rhizocola TaxID=3382643 RepID=UPI0038B46A65